MASAIPVGRDFEYPWCSFRTPEGLLGIMADRQIQLGNDNREETASRVSSVPLLGEGFQEHASRAGSAAEIGTTATTESDINKSSKRRFWNIGKKKDDEKASKKKEALLANTPSTTIAPSSLKSPGSTFTSIGNSPALAKTSSSSGDPSSPGRNLRSSSPAPHSPASSQIFERSVQEDGIAAASPSPAIPAHITTENHIPSVLDASSEAITNDHLNPDNVEIVMHTAHQPAAVTVTGTGSSEATGNTWQDDLVAHPDIDDAASNYGALDSTDVRRLSFISFADVVHAEHADHPGSAAPSTISPVASYNRSPSPIRSPLSSHMQAGPPSLSDNMTSKGLETSPNRGGKAPVSSFPGHSPPERGELTIETMRQALRKTGSGDLSGARSAPLSATGVEDGTIEHSFK